MHDHYTDVSDGWQLNRQVTADFCNHTSDLSLVTWGKEKTTCNACSTGCFQSGCINCHGVYNLDILCAPAGFFKKKMFAIN